MTDEEAMNRAIAMARAGIAAGQSPIGAILARDGMIVAERHNTVVLDIDPSAHAEMNAIRSACRSLGSIDLAGTTCYSTLEPCPMCLAALHWARVDRVVFGAAILDAQKAGFNEMTIPAEMMADLGGSHLEVQGGLMADECVALFDEWKATGQARTY